MIDRSPRTPELQRSPPSALSVFGVVSLGPVYGWAPIVAINGGQQLLRRGGGASGSVCWRRVGSASHARAGNRRHIR